MRCFASFVGLLAALGCAGAHDLQPGDPQTGGVSHQVFTIAIEVPDSKGVRRRGVALSTKPFGDGVEAYFAQLTVKLADEFKRPLQTTDFEERLGRARTFMQTTEPENPTASYAFIFEDADVVGWSGPNADLSGVPADRLTADVGIKQAATNFNYDGAYGLSAGNVHNSLNYLCIGYAQAGITMDHGYLTQPGGDYSFHGPTGTLFSCTMHWGSAPYVDGCNSGIVSGGYGYYWYTVRANNWGFAVDYTQDSWVGCD